MAIPSKHDRRAQLIIFHAIRGLIAKAKTGSNYATGWTTGYVDYY